MKKKLEADLMSIAHRVLQMKNKSDINQLFVETQKLYEKLSVLRFVEEHFGDAKPTIGQAEIVEKMKRFFEENQLSSPKPAFVKEEIVAEDNADQDEIEAEEMAPITETEFNEIDSDEEEIVIATEEESNEEVIVENEIIPTNDADFNEIDSDEEEIVIDSEEESSEDIIADAEISPAKDADFNEIEPDEEGEGEEISEEETLKSSNLGFLPAFELDTEEDEKIVSPKKIEAIQISFEELLGKDYSDTLFVKADAKKELTSPIDFEIPKGIVSQDTVAPKEIEAKSSDLNDKFAAGISIGLNDKIAFVKQLFGNSDEDYNRVMNQLITFSNFQEAQSFIEEMVKPDYNYWEGKEDYELRFIEIIEKKFE